jgi:hypothetical protein
MSTHASLLTPPSLAPAPQIAPTRPVASHRSWRAPRPNAVLMHLLGFVGRWLLRGLPVLRRVPVVRDLPLVRGYFRVRAIDLPATDRRRLAGAVNAGTVAFLAPNHPEFATDWLIDKEISTVVAPRMASWADRGIVSLAPRFWAMNNLVSNDGGADAKEYSIRWAIAGEGALLHPEGTVRWTNDFVHPLFPGVAQMAAAAARRTSRPVYIVPLVWKFRFVGDVSRGLHREMEAIERGLELPVMDWLCVAQRFRVLQCSVLAIRMDRFGHRAPLDTDFFDRQTSFQSFLLAQLARYDVESASKSTEQKLASITRRIHRARRALQDDASADADDERRRLDADLERAEEAARLGELTQALYGSETLTQEQIFECLKRTRDRLLRRGWHQRLTVMLPRPAGPRVVHVGVPEPIRVVPVDSDEADDYERELLERTRTRMQQALDAINRRIAPEVDRYRCPNALAARTEG